MRGPGRAAAPSALRGDVSGEHMQDKGGRLGLRNRRTSIGRHRQDPHQGEQKRSDHLGGPACALRVPAGTKLVAERSARRSDGTVLRKFLLGQNDQPDPSLKRGKRMQWLDANIVVDNNEYPYHVIVFDAADNPCNLDPVIVNDGSPTGSTRTFEPRADLVHRLFVRERATAGFGCGEACLSE